MVEIKNSSVYHHFFIDALYEAGMVLKGTEVKSIRAGKLSFNDAFCVIYDNEVWVKSLYIGEYSHGNLNNHVPAADRKLLLQKREIRKIISKLKEKGYTLVPVRVFENENRLLKMEIGLAKGKKLYDKRETLKKKDIEREIQRYVK